MALINLNNLGGGGGVVAHKNIYIVDSDETQVAGSIASDVKEAVDWIVANETLNSNNRWTVIVNNPYDDSIEFFVI